MYSKTLYAGWGDMDFNSHMANTAYINKCGDVRLGFYAENGFPIEEFMRLKIGPVTMRDELDYFKEVSLLQEITVTMALAGLSTDGSRWLMRNELLRPDGKLCARVQSRGGWLNLAIRKLVIPPQEMLDVMMKLDRTEDFGVLPSSVKSGES